MNAQARYIDIHGVCARYCIGRRTVWRWVAKQILPEPTYFDGAQSGARWKVRELDALDERRDAEREATVA